MKQLLIRLDDITPDMNWESFEMIRTIFDKYHIKPIIGVVPDNRDQALSVADPCADFWNIIRELQTQGWTIAQHGYRHVYETKNSGMLGINPFSEFAGLPYEVQYEKIEKGREILRKQGICVRMFMAPGHTYDRNTLRVLKKLDFTMVTDGYSNRPYCEQDIIFIPCTLAKPKLPKNVDTLCLHINTMSRGEIDELEHFLEVNRKFCCSVEELFDVKGTIHDCNKTKNMSAVAKKNLSIRLEERKNLFIRKVKRFVAENEILKQFLERTDDQNAAVKRRKRILGLPGLAAHLLFRKKYQ